MLFLLFLASLQNIFYLLRLKNVLSLFFMYSLLWCCFIPHFTTNLVFLKPYLIPSHLSNAYKFYLHFDQLLLNFLILYYHLPFFFPSLMVSVHPYLSRVQWFFPLYEYILHLHCQPDVPLQIPSHPESHVNWQLLPSMNLYSATPYPKECCTPKNFIPSTIKTNNHPFLLSQASISPPPFLTWSSFYTPCR